MDGLIAYALAKKYADQVGQSILDAGFKVQVEQDRSILNQTGEQMTLYLLPKESSLSSDTYDEYVYTNKWEQVGSTDIDLSDYATQTWVNQQIGAAQEIYTGNSAPTGTQTVWIDTSQTPVVVKFKINNTWTDMVDIVEQGFLDADNMYFPLENESEVAGE